MIAHRRSLAKGNPKDEFVTAATADSRSALTALLTKCAGTKHRADNTRAASQLRGLAQSNYDKFNHSEARASETAEDNFHQSQDKRQSKGAQALYQPADKATPAGLPGT